MRLVDFARRRICLPAALLIAALCAGCKKPASQADGGDSSAGDADSPGASAQPGGSAASARQASDQGPRLAANMLTALVRERPDPSSPTLGYLRLGAIVPRSAGTAGTDRCPSGWYGIKPRGYVCVGKGATLDLEDPVVRASQVRPDLTRALPYRYAFVRAVAPQYLRVPTAEEQYKTEFKLREHLGWWGRHAAEVDRVQPGANDVPLDEQGVAWSPPPDTPADAALSAGFPTRAASYAKPSTELSVGELLGGQSDQDPLPFWLAGGGRRIPNIAALRAPPSTRLFAERVKRHTGLALVGTFVTGAESLDRRFAITVDLRLVPADKLKPDTASMFHGTAVTPQLPFPLAFVRKACNLQQPIGCARGYELDGNEPRAVGAPLPYRSVVKLTGKKRFIEAMGYVEMADGRWLKTTEAGIGAAPSEWPPGAKSGKKWIEISIMDETLVLWEGQTPVYFTLVSAGQDGLRDPKTTKSTPLGTFRIFNKQITATMDSNEHATSSSSSSSAAAQAQASSATSPSAGSGSESSITSARASRSDSQAASSDRKGRSSGPAPSTSPGSASPASTSRAGASPASTSRASASPPGAPPAGASTSDENADKPSEAPFELRDVPYVQYFESGYALHAAYWHDAFGTARSHGCVNLSPIDARRVFLWTEPQVPEGWHGISIPVGQGTLVVIHK